MTWTNIAGSVSLLGVAKVLSLQASELPASWSSDSTAGPCMAASFGTFAAGHCPLPPAVQQADNEKFARCLKVPISRVGMLTGSDEPGEPFTYSSSTFTGSGGSDTNPVAMAPSAQSYLSIEKSTPEERFDLAAFSAASFLGCYTILQKGATWALLKSLAVAGHLSLSSAPLHKLPISKIAGVTAVAYQDQLNFHSARFTGSIIYSMVILGAGPIEEVLDLQGSSAYPFPARLESKIVTDVERHLAGYAGRD